MYLSKKGGERMATIRSMSFVEKDEQLVKDIVAYQKYSKLPHFVDAVRTLCADALKFKEISR